jgi:SpoVK/Ycf46/Vps4 family AAA+-type ATPase
MDLQKELELCIRSRFTLVCIVSMDEERILTRVSELCRRTRRTLYTWDHADHFDVVGESRAVVPKAADPIAALEAIEKIDAPSIFLLRDFHQCWDKQPRVVRKLRNLSQRLKYTHHTILVTMPTQEIPRELEDAAVRLVYPPPAEGELAKLLDRLLATPGARHDLTADARDRLLRAALGLSSNQAQRVFAKAIVTHGVLDERDVELIAEEKKQIVKASGALEYYTPQETLLDVGGLGLLKDWLRKREAAFGRKAREYGLPAPKGIALIGIPGTGKSLTAKTVASLWRMPLLRLDLGAVFGSYVGQSEENIRRALTIAETIAPCILWIDEIEKGLSTGDGDGGTSMRVLGTMLSWMQEKTKPVFVVATANDVSKLPPELLRRGRFDEVFFLDLPTDSERADILDVHLRKRGRSPGDYDLARLARASEGHVGAEIEQAVIEAMYHAFNDPDDPAREFTTDDVAAAMHRLVPLSRSQRETIEYLRLWLTEGRARSASFDGDERIAPEFVPIPIEPQVDVDVAGSAE